MIGAVGSLLLGYQHALSGSPFESGYQTFSRMRHWGLIGQAARAPAPLPSIHELGLHAGPLELLALRLAGLAGARGLLPRVPGGLRLFASCAGVLLLYGGISAASISRVGPAHYAELAVPLVILSASGFLRLIELSRRIRSPAGAPAFVASSPARRPTLCALITFLPVYAGSLRASADLAERPLRSRGDRGAGAGASRRLRPQPPGHRAASLLLGLLPPQQSPRPDAIAFSSSNFLDAERNSALMQALPERVPYVMGMDGARLVLKRVTP